MSGAPGSSKSMDKKQYLGIVVLNVPDDLWDQALLQRHFSQYGTIRKMGLDTKTKNAVITYDKPGEAERAKEKGGLIENSDQPLKILYTDKQMGRKIPAGSGRTNTATPPPLIPMEMTQSIKSSPSRGTKSVRGASSSSALAATATSEMHSLFVFYPDTPEAKELFEKPAFTSEERYRLLEDRDKLIRARNPKVKVKVENAVKLAGTCKDMCPEKERYMRDYQRQLVCYEMLAGKDNEVDHRLAVKAYSRSSADQEEPLPHELRPCEALEMSLLYLLHKIIPSVENTSRSELDLANWYNFVWDRTRSIRKDITQQQLYDLRAVALMEKCARFHIFCSSRLCELDRNNFDTKLNDENLMKCLQSLEHMYTDLNLLNIICPNEPEFRAYQILMNLNEGDILWDVQQKPDWVQKSGEVQFAIKIHMAVFQKNYALFFKQVRKAPYMTACILHRYFFQVRCTAMLTIFKAYSMHNKSENYASAPAIQTVLGFGDNYDAFSQFCGSHGIQIDSEKERLILNRRNFDEPEFPNICREHYLIESKLDNSVNVIINGGPLGPDPLLTHSPHTSFNAQGYLIPGELTGVPEDKVSFLKPMPKPLPLPVASAPPLPVQQWKALPLPGDVKLFPKQETKPFPMGTSLQTKQAHLPDIKPIIGTGSSIFGQPFQGSASYGEASGFKPLFRAPTPVPYVNHQAVKLEKMSKRAEEVYDGMVKSMIQDVAKACQREQQLRNKLIQRERERTLTALRLYQKIEEHTVKTMIFKIWQDHREWQRRMSAKAAQLSNKITNDTITQVITRISTQCIADNRRALNAKLARLKKLMDQVKLRQCIKKWKFYAKKKALKRRTEAEAKLQELENFPSYQNTSVSSPKELLKIWAGGECCSPSHLISLSHVAPRPHFKRELEKELLQPVDNKRMNLEGDTETLIELYNFPPTSNVNNDSPAAILASWCGMVASSSPTPGELEKELLQPVDNKRMNLEGDTETLIELYNFPPTSNVNNDSPAAILASWCGMVASSSPTPGFDTSTPKRRRYDESETYSTP